MLRPTAKAKSPRMVPNIGRSDLPPRAKHFRKKEPTRGRGERVSCTEHGTAGLDGIQALPDHGNDGSCSHVLDQAREERFSLEILVVWITAPDLLDYAQRRARKTRRTLLEVLGGGVNELQSDELEAAALKTADNVANESPLDTVGLER
jgi:hypothetical protein